MSGIVSIGKYTYDMKNIKLEFGWGPSSLFVGSFCSISNNCTIFLGGNHRTDWITTFPFGHIYKEVFNKFDGKGHPKTNGHVVIENDVWIGNNVTIMSGVIIGSGSVIAANSHVVKSMFPYSMVGGNPAKLIKYRFNDEIIAKLLKLQWWNMSDEKINKISPLLCSNNFNELFKVQI